MEINLPVNVWSAGVIAAVSATVVNFVIAKVAGRLTNASPEFAPFTFLPIAAGGFGGALSASLIFYGLQLVFDRPQLVFVVVSAVVLLASFHLPFRLTEHRSPRFAGATLPMQLTLCLMHAVVAAFSIVSLILFTS